MNFFKRCFIWLFCMILGALSFGLVAIPYLSQVAAAGGGVSNTLTLGYGVMKLWQFGFAGPMSSVLQILILLTSLGMFLIGLIGLIRELVLSPAPELKKGGVILVLSFTFLNLALLIMLIILCARSKGGYYGDALTPYKLHAGVFITLVFGILASIILLILIKVFKDTSVWSSARQPSNNTVVYNNQVYNNQSYGGYPAASYPNSGMVSMPPQPPLLSAPPPPAKNKPPVNAAPQYSNGIYEPQAYIPGSSYAPSPYSQSAGYPTQSGYPYQSSYGAPGDYRNSDPYRSNAYPPPYGAGNPYNKPPAARQPNAVSFSPQFICMPPTETSQSYPREADNKKKRETPDASVSFRFVEGLSDKQIRDAVDDLTVRANKGEADAQFRLGICYANGTGVQKNIGQAIAWQQKASAQGHPQAKFVLGDYYINGTGTPKKLVEGIVLIKESAAKGFVGAQMKLGMFYQEGEYLPKDFEKAVQWYSKAAEQGNEYSIAALRGFEKDVFGKWKLKA